MSAEENFCTMLVKRLSGLDYFPQTKEAALELTNTLMRAKNNREACEVVDEWLDSTREAPKPCDVLRILWARRREEEGLKYLGDPDCPDCQGSGYRIRTVNGVDGAERCECTAKGVSP